VLTSFADRVVWTWPGELLVSALVIGAQQFIIGAVVGRLSRRVGPPIAIIYAATILCAFAIDFVVFMTADAARGELLLGAAQALMTLGVVLPAAVMGALWSTGRHQVPTSS
jgi:hypothetical protein